MHLVLVILAQILSATYFVGDILYDILTEDIFAPEEADLLPEALITLTLVLAIYFEVRFLRMLTRRKTALERQVNIAAGALHEVIADHFDAWALTPAERDVALFTLKGLTIPEIASHRGSAEGTVKSQLNAIYRKADVAGRGALLSLLIEDLMHAPLLENGAATLPEQSPHVADQPPQTDQQSGHQSDHQSGPLPAK
ncbi:MULTISPECIES: helix-turn-helix transcriptional regulator [unclassified Marinovum]